MCDHHNHDESNHDETSQGARFGDALEHGEAHTHDHQRWSRRDFLVRAGMTAGGIAMTLGGTPVRVLGNSPVLARMAAAASDRVLVLIQLRGGNDGLNMVVPVTNDAYYNIRPTLGLGVSETFPLNVDHGLNNVMSSLQPMWGDGQMGVIHNVGYPSPSLSHFRGTDNWMTSELSPNAQTGWVGRSLDYEYPDFATDPNPYDWPFAIEVSSSPTVLFEGPETRMGIAMRNPEEFARLALTGNLYDTDDVSADAYGSELSYLRGVANSANRYADTIKTASDAAVNDPLALYPSGSLGDSLATVARLIKGGLRTGVYAVQIGSFDTHSNQINQHNNLLAQLADAVLAFQTDLGDKKDNVLTMTYSEFGRRPTENAGRGTDHGTGSAMLLWGSQLQGGLYGTPPDLDGISPGANPLFGTDFRSVYSTVLERWFGIPGADVNALLGGSFGTVDFLSATLAKGAFADAAASDEQPPVSFALESNYPNPFRDATTITYSLPRATHAVLRVVDTAGREVRRLVDKAQASGRYEINFDGSSLPSGRYFYRLETSLGYDTKTMTVVR